MCIKILMVILECCKGSNIKISVTDGKWERERGHLWERDKSFVCVRERVWVY